MEIKRHMPAEKMSKAVIHGNVAYLCGQTAEGENITVQTQVMLKKVDDLLADINLDKTKVLSATIYLKDMKDFDAMNDVWNKWIVEGLQPARACVQAKMCKDEMLVEISVIAGL
jgi:enamine deaminase RidA (YjgF/YER057c/UK114 family)